MEELLPLSIGWYGKLPSRGDFVGRGLPRDWLRTWDDWLQRGFSEAAGRLGAGVLRERMRSMPAWHCVVCPDATGGPVWSGVVAPSCDRVGRAYPLLLAEAYDAEALRRTALRALHARAQALAAWLREAASTASPKDFEKGVAQVAATAWRDEPDAGTRCGDGLAGLRGEPAAASFWWRLGRGDDAEAPLAEAWPPRDGLVLRMLDGG